MQGKQYKWWVVFMLWFVCFFNYADRQAIFSVFPLLKAEMGLSDVQLGIVASAFMWVYAGFAPIAGLIADRVSKKTLIVGGLMFWSLVTVATGLSTSYAHLVLFRALEGFGEAFYFPASMALVSGYHGSETRSRAMSIHQSSVYAGTIAGGTLAGVLAQFYGWRSGFYLFGSLGFLLGIVLVWLLKEPERSTESLPVTATGSHHALDLRGGNVWDTLKALLSNPMVRILIAVFVGANFVAMIFLTWMPSYLYNTFNMSLAMAGLSGTVYLQISSVLGVLCGGFLADRWSKLRRGGRMLTQALGLLCGVPFIFLSGWTLSVTVLVLALIGMGFFKGMYDANIWASMHDVVRPEHRASVVGFANCIGWLGGGMAPVAIALASQHYGMSVSLSLTSLVYLGVGLLLLYGVRRYMQPAEKPLFAQL